jgi:hypothetical protein
VASCLATTVDLNMLVYFATRPHCHTMQTFLDTWGQSLRGIMQVVSYEYANTVRYSEVSTVIFSDYDRLSADDRAGFGALCEALKARGIRVLNHPQHSARRAQLLALLRRQGSNEFSAYPAAEAERAKFPVFVRFANEHKGPQSPLLHSAEEVQKCIQIGLDKGVPYEEMLVVEFCNTLEADGLYQKYSAFCIEGKVLPRHYLASAGQWSVRDVDLLTPEIIAKELAYLQTNPHEQFVRDVFKLAKIDYGRIDYSLLKGKPQVWEINPNPIVMQHPDKYKPEHKANQEWFAERIVPLFAELALWRK